MTPSAGVPVNATRLFSREHYIAAAEAYMPVKGTMPIDGGDAEAVLAEFAAAGVDDDTLAADMQRAGAPRHSPSRGMS